MPGIDTALETQGLPARLGALLVAATAKLEALAPDASPESVARAVGVIARSGAALAAWSERLARRRGRKADGIDATEEADMDGADDAGLDGPDLDDDERVARGLRALARNLRLPGGLDGDLPQPAAGDPAGAPGELGRTGAGAPVAA